MAQLYRIGETNPKNGQRREVRFDLSQLIEQQHEHEQQPPIVGPVQERYAGFFELPERCVPFEPVPLDDGGGGAGFPALVDLLGEERTECSKTPAENEADQDGKAEEINGEDGQRHKKKPTKKKSLFAQHFEAKQSEYGHKSDGREKGKSEKGEEGDETIKNLEVMPTKQAKEEEMEIGSDAPRYAMDPVHFDLETKCLRHVAARQEQQIVRLFDMLAIPSSSSSSPSSLTPILEEARQSIEQIHSLYLEQILNEESGRTSWQFARQFGDPFSDGAWTLKPIRRVLDAVQQRNPPSATSDDVEIVRLTLLWTVLFAHERPTLFRAFVSVSDFYCRLAELYLLGPRVFFLDSQISDCVSALLEVFLLKAAGPQGLLELRLHRPIAGLDAFMPFYEDLLGRFEEFACPDDNFSLLLLIGAYMNRAQPDALLMAQTLWSPRRQVVRQMTLSEQKAAPLLAHIAATNSTPDPDDDNELFTERAKLALHYALAVRDGAVLPERNGALHALARAELRAFVKAQKMPVGEDAEWRRRRMEVARRIRAMVADKIDEI